MKSLREHSRHKDDPIPEWEIIHMSGGETGECICGMHISNLFTIENKLTRERLIIGSECQQRWNIKCKLECEKCKSALGGVITRYKKRDFLCPTCKRETKKLMNTLAKFIMYYPGPWKGLSFKDVGENQEWVSLLINLNSSSKTIIAFQKYCNLIYEIE